MAYVPPTTGIDPDTSGWGGRPNSLWNWHRHHNDSFMPKYPNPSNYYYPNHYYPPPPPTPPPKGYNASYAPPVYPPPPGPPQPYWHQSWPNSSLTPYPMQPPTFSADYPPPPPPSSSAFQNYPAYPNQQPALTLYINPALLTPTPFYNRPVSPHSPPYEPPQWRRVKDDKKVRFSQGTRSPPSSPRSHSRVPSYPGPYTYQPPIPTHAPSNPPPPPPTPKQASDPVSFVPVRPSSPLSSALSPQSPPPGLPQKAARRAELSRSSRLPESEPPTHHPRDYLIPSQIREFTVPIIESSSPDDFELPSPPEKNTDVSSTRPIKKLVPQQLPTPSSSNPGSWEPPPHPLPWPYQLLSSDPSSWIPPAGTTLTVKSNANRTPPYPIGQDRRHPVADPTPANPLSGFTEIQGRVDEIPVGFAQIVKVDKLEQGLKNADPKLKVLEDLFYMPKLLELLNLGAYRLPRDQPHEDATVENENNAGQISGTREHPEGAPGVVISSISSSDEDDELSAEDGDSRGDLRLGSIRETSVENVVPEIPPSPLGYSIDLVCVDDSDHDGSDVDNYDTTSLDPDFPDGNSTHVISGKS